MEIPIQSNHFHNPYTMPYLALFPEQNNFSAHWLESGSIENLDSNFYEDNISILSSLKLHSQTISPIKSGLTVTFGLAFTMSSYFIQTRTLAMLKQEKSVNNKMMVTQAKLHMIFWPMNVIGTLLTDNIYPLTAYFPVQICHIWSFLAEFGSLCIILYSFYAALLRYIMLMHTKRAETFGKERLISIIYWIYYSHAFFWALYSKFIRFNMETLPILNKCYGWMDRIYLLELHDSSNMMKRHFCAFEDSNDGKS